MAEYRQRARDLRSQVPRHLDYKIPLQDSTRPSGRACARPDSTDLSGQGSGDHTRRGVAGPHPHAGVCATASGADEASAIHQGALFAPAARRIPRTSETVLGQHLWARGYFCATVGAVDEATIKAYIENQKWDEDDQAFKITAPTEP